MPTPIRPGSPDDGSVQTRMLRALVAFVTIMTGASLALAQTVTTDDPGPAPPGSNVGSIADWWWVVVLVLAAVVLIRWAMRRRGPGPR